MYSQKCKTGRNNRYSATWCPPWLSFHLRSPKLRGNIWNIHRDEDTPPTPQHNSGQVPHACPHVGEKRLAKPTSDATWLQTPLRSFATDPSAREHLPLLRSQPPMMVCMIMSGKACSSVQEDPWKASAMNASDSLALMTRLSPPVNTAGSGCFRRQTAATGRHHRTGETRLRTYPHALHTDTPHRLGQRPRPRGEVD